MPGDRRAVDQEPIKPRVSARGPTDDDGSVLRRKPAGTIRWWEGLSALSLAFVLAVGFVGIVTVIDALDGRIEPTTLATLAGTMGPVIAAYLAWKDR